jgi:hypothetical protein
MPFIRIHLILLFPQRIADHGFLRNRFVIAVCPKSIMITPLLAPESRGPHPPA